MSTFGIVSTNPWVTTVNWKLPDLVVGGPVDLVGAAQIDVSDSA